VASPPLAWNTVTGGGQPGVSQSGKIRQDLGVFINCDRLLVCFTVTGLNPNGLERLQVRLEDAGGTSTVSIANFTENGDWCVQFNTDAEPSETYLTFQSFYDSNPPSSITSNLILSNISAKCLDECVEIDVLDEAGNVVASRASDQFTTNYVFPDDSRITAWRINLDEVETFGCFQIKATCGEEIIYSDFFRRKVMTADEKCTYPKIFAGRGGTGSKWIFDRFYFDDVFPGINFRLEMTIKNFTGGGELTVFNYAQQFASIDSYKTLQTGFLDEWRLRCLNYMSKMDFFLIQVGGSASFKQYLATEASFEPVYIQQWLLGSVEIKVQENNGIEQNNFC
jgi:hypothetical protein